MVKIVLGESIEKEEETIPSPTGDTQPHICEFCHDEFWQLDEYMEHKELCINNAKRRRIMFDSNSVDGSVTNGDISEPIRSQSVSDGEEELSPEEDEGIYPEEFSRHAHLNGDYTHENKMEDLSDDEDELKEDDKENKITDESKVAMAAQLPQLMSLANMANMANILPTSNVKLEPMSGTKAAVAQFAENNNLMPNDMAVLQATLFTLQQQQIVQLQLIQQLQNQIVTKTDEDEEEEEEGDEDLEQNNEDAKSETKSETSKPPSPVVDSISDSNLSSKIFTEDKLVKSESEKPSPDSMNPSEGKYINSLAAMNNMTYNSLPKETPVQRGSILPPHLLSIPPDDGYAQRGTGSVVRNINELCPLVIQSL
ncbi:hypothetical protein LOTGIDRAFT_171141 [Lottia gigantea]|uniref:C2H2-type domain-containing protein n=1 Tax=Lottia gigantea TaxID=225164 RepID=V4B0M2_LOTGI|nr:hypothetical protein LOTGIDRAFT_171141 [Lottia gigantea]ESP03713.1 hypothetical protein LOTGIDRAFT_171141 [Lottia gigantea]